MSITKAFLPYRVQLSQSRNKTLLCMIGNKNKKQEGLQLITADLLRSNQIRYFFDGKEFLNPATRKQLAIDGITPAIEQDVLNFLQQHAGEKRAIVYYQAHDQYMCSGGVFTLTFLGGIKPAVTEDGDNLPPHVEFQNAYTHSYHHEKELVLDQVIQGCAVEIPGDKEYIVPGTGRAHFKFTSSGFKFEFIEFSNSLLEEIYLCDQSVVLSDEKVEFAECEEELIRTLIDCKNKVVQDLGWNVLAEAVKLYHQPQDKKNLATLSHILRETNVLIKHPDADHVYQYSQYAHTIKSGQASRQWQGLSLTMLYLGLFLSISGILFMNPAMVVIGGVSLITSVTFFLKGKSYGLHKATNDLAHEMKNELTVTKRAVTVLN